MANILVTGGAGYIGSHTCLHLFEKGYTPVVYDNLLNGHRDFVQWGPFEHGDIRDRTRIDEVILAYNPVAIVHFAGLIEVSESIANPMAFFETNVTGSLSLFAAAMEAGIDKLVFSSTCATYGVPNKFPISESHPQIPISPYGKSKLLVEQILTDLSKYKHFRSVTFRYFNAAGADQGGRIGEWHTPETHVIPLAIEAAQGKRQSFKIFGSDYPTRDGTCIRDFVHVMDLADAHARGVDYLLSGGSTTAINLGTGEGTSIIELLKTIEQSAGRPVAVQREKRREGDSPHLVSDSSLAHSILGWEPRHDLRSIVQTAWDWHGALNRKIAGHADCN